MVVTVFSRTSLYYTDEHAFTYHAEKFIKGQNSKPCDRQHHHFRLDVVLATPLFSLVTPIFWVLLLGSTKTECFARTITECSGHCYYFDLYCTTFISTFSNFQCIFSQKVQHSLGLIFMSLHC